MLEGHSYNCEYAWVEQLSRSGLKSSPFYAVLVCDIMNILKLSAKVTVGNVSA